MNETESQEFDDDADTTDTVTVTDMVATETIGGISSGEEAQFLAQNPGLKKLFNQFLDERLKQEQKNVNNSRQSLTNTLKVTKSNRPGGEGESNDRMRRINVVKSPSDTTIYAPALTANRASQDIHVVREINVNSPEAEQIWQQRQQLTEDETNRNGNQITTHDKGSLIDKIANFVESIREEMPSTSRAADEDMISRRDSVVKVPGFEEAKQRNDRAIIEAEKFKASIANPPGMYVADKIDCSRPDVGSGISDDDFFHLTCHIDETLKSKIENGEFIDLEKLLPKEKVNGVVNRSTDETPMRWVNTAEGTFLVPVKSENRINGFRHWEQAFRSYATIYCGANQSRAKEIWQYISVINTAASSFVWDNVYSYDIVFRQLMEFKPRRSWAITYTQMWNLCMKEHLPVNRNFKSGGDSNFASASTSYSRQSNQGNDYGTNAQGMKRSTYCWSFNRGQTCKFGRNCKYVERCKYCDSPSHGIVNCMKLENKERGQQNQNQNGYRGNPNPRKGNNGNNRNHNQSHSNTTTNTGQAKKEVNIPSEHKQ